MNNSNFQIPSNQNTNTTSPVTVYWSEARGLPGVLSKWSEYTYTITDTPNLPPGELINGFYKFGATEDHLSEGVRCSHSNDGSVQYTVNVEGDPSKKPFVAGLDCLGFIVPLDSQRVESRRRQLLNNSNPQNQQSDSEMIDSDTETPDEFGIDEHIRRLEVNTDEIKNKQYYAEFLIYDHHLSKAKHSFERGICNNIECLGDKAPTVVDSRDLLLSCTDQLPNPERSSEEAFESNAIWGEHNTLCQHVESILDEEDVEYYRLKTSREGKKSNNQFKSIPPNMIRKIIRTYRPDLSKSQQSSGSDTSTTTNARGRQIELENKGIHEFARHIIYPHTIKQDMESIEGYHKLKSAHDVRVHDVRDP